MNRMYILIQRFTSQMIKHPYGCLLIKVTRIGHHHHNTLEDFQANVERGTLRGRELVVLAEKAAAEPQSPGIGFGKSA